MVKSPNPAEIPSIFTSSLQHSRWWEFRACFCVYRIAEFCRSFLHPWIIANWYLVAGSRVANVVCVVTAFTADLCADLSPSARLGPFKQLDFNAWPAWTVSLTLHLPHFFTIFQNQEFHTWQLSIYHNCNSTMIRLRYHDATRLWNYEITIYVWFDCDTTTTKNWHVHFLLTSNGSRRARCIVVGS